MLLSFAHIWSSPLLFSQGLSSPFSRCLDPLLEPEQTGIVHHSFLLCFFPHLCRLTAFVTKCFGQAQKFIFIDDKNIQDALKWMAGNQLPSGCYNNVGKLLHTAMKVGSLGEPAAPTVPGGAFSGLACCGCSRSSAYQSGLQSSCLWNKKSLQSLV